MRNLPGVLLETFPEPRAKVTRAEKAAAKTQKKATQEEAVESPIYAFAIGSYIIDRNGKLRGKKNKELAEALAAQGFTAA